MLSKAPKSISIKLKSAGAPRVSAAPRQECLRASKIHKDLQLPHHFAAPAALQEQQQDYTSRNPNQNLHHCAIHDRSPFS
jgi:hypothetical protein